MKRILLATDFSDTCRNALEYTISLLKETKICIDLVHVFDLPIVAASSLPAFAFDDSLNEHEKNVITHLEKLAETIPEQNRGTVAALYNPSTALAISDFGKPEEYFIIVMGLRKRYTLIDRLVGTVTAQTINLSDAAVLAVPHGARFDSIHKIVFPTTMAYDQELSDKEEKVLQWLSDLSSIFRFAKIHMIHINKTSAPINPEITFKHKPFEGIDFSRSYSQTIEDGILAFCEQEHAELLTFYKPHRTFWENIFHSSLTQKLLRKSKTPLLVFSK